jgi:hypothetical protein
VRACAISALIRALGAGVEYADLRGIELFKPGGIFLTAPLRATNAMVSDLPSVNASTSRKGKRSRP